MSLYTYRSADVISFENIIMPSKSDTPYNSNLRSLLEELGNNIFRLSEKGGDFAKNSSCQFIRASKFSVSIVNLNFFL